MTAVEWLEQEFIKLESTTGVHGKMYELIEQAKEMEKQMVIDIVEKSRATGLTAEYLLLTYGSKGSDENIANGSEKQYLSQINTSQTEISDEEIENEATHYKETNGSYSFKMAIKWYREQLGKANLSDEEILAEAKSQFNELKFNYAFYVGATWYREQLKKK